MSASNWGDSYRLVASEKWKQKSAAMGRDVTQALVEYADPKPGMRAAVLRRSFDELWARPADVYELRAL